MQISLWSNMHGQAAVSANTAALASTIAQKTSLRTLVTHNHLERSALERYLFKSNVFSDKGIQSISDQGVDALLRLMKNGRLRPDMVADYTYSSLKNHRMDILMGTAKRDRTAPGDDILINKIIGLAREFYDLVLIDVHSGLEHSNCMDILRDSDMIIFCINQNVFLINELMQMLDHYEFLKEKKSAFAVSRYDKNSSLTLNNIARRFNLAKTPVYTIPNSPLFSDALNSGRVFEYIAINQSAKDYEERALTQSFNRLCDYIVEGCKINC